MSTDINARHPEIPVVVSPDTERPNRVPPGQRLTRRWPVLHFGRVPAINETDWAFSISGLVAEEKRLSLPEFHSLPVVRVLSDIHCVTRWSRLDNTWEGVSTCAVRDLANVLPEARFVVVHGAARFTTNLTLDDFFQPDALFAWAHDNKPLSPRHGGPVRLVVPQLYFWKSAKWVTGIEFVADDRPGFWESSGYHNHGNPWLEERYSSH